VPSHSQLKAAVVIAIATSSNTKCSQASQLGQVKPANPQHLQCATKPLPHEFTERMTAKDVAPKSDIVQSKLQKPSRMK
jgi:hypothetical protein